MTRPARPTLHALLAVCCAAAHAHAQAQPQAPDPTRTDGDKYSVLLDNARVRVLRYHDEPGQRTQSHHHPAFVVVALAPFKRKLVLADGRTMTREFQAGDAMYSEGETHVGENVGHTPTQVLMVELKDGAACPAGR